MKAGAPFEKFMPMLVTGWEGGMLGYALFSLLYGNAGTKVFAIADIGQTVFAFSLFISVLKVIGPPDSPSARAVPVQTARQSELLSGMNQPLQGTLR